MHVFIAGDECLPFLGALKSVLILNQVSFPENIGKPNPDSAFDLSMFFIWHIKQFVASLVPLNA